MPTSFLSYVSQRIYLQRGHYLYIAANSFGSLLQYSAKTALTIKTYDRIGKQVVYSSATGDKRVGKPQSDRAVVSVEEAFSDLDIDIRRCRGKFLATTKEVVANGVANERLMGRAEFCNERYSCLLEYPIKTCNFNDRDWFFQTDTGPVLFPNLDVPDHHAHAYCSPLLSVPDK